VNDYFLYGILHKPTGRLYNGAHSTKLRNPDRSINAFFEGRPKLFSEQGPARNIIRSLFHGNRLHWSPERQREFYAEFKEDDLVIVKLLLVPEE